MNIFICSKCGHVAYGSAPEKCPVCSATKEAYKQNDKVFAESMEKSKEAAVKHIPSVKVIKECKLIPEESCVDVIVRIGATLHPMKDEHFIQFIDCYVDNKYISRVFLTPGVNPSACFHLRAKGAKVQIVEKCNLHGYWQTEDAL